MHELYITECIFESVKTALPAGVLPASVQQVQVQVGQLDAVIPETLTFLFDAIKESQGMPQAKLDIEQINVLCRCQDCNFEFGIDLPLFLCPACGGGQVDVLQGRGITLIKIIAEDVDSPVRAI